ncbi:MAG TPA: hypothetical protein VFP43_10720 [Mesorhizobium sp.]|nr:hypothetical protein [Mesorhizobium sp.]
MKYRTLAAGAFAGLAAPVMGLQTEMNATAQINATSGPKRIMSRVVIPVATPKILPPNPIVGNI